MAEVTVAPKLPAMHVLVLGAGVVGVTTAFVLAESGACVTVIDRRPGPGLETSFANGGHLSASEVRSWASPMVPGYLAKWIGRADAPFRMPLLRWDPMLWRWGLRYLANCTPARYRANNEALLRLAHYSRAAMQEIVAASGVAFDHRPAGLLAVCRTAESLRQAVDESDSLARADLVHDQVVSAAECVRIEPALADSRGRGQIAGGLFSRDGGTGNAAAFTTGLAAACVAGGVTFRYDTTIQAIEHSDGRVTGVQTSVGRIAGDAIVLALANESRAIAAPLGLALPLYPVKGYSITVPMSESESRLPHIGILDEDRKIVLARFGSAVRVAGTAEFAGFDQRLDLRRVRPILDAARDLFPGPLDGIRPEHANPWTGLRPMTPDGPPIVGPDPRAPKGLFFNTGHGSLGWTLAAATARMTADYIGGRAPAVDSTPYSLARFRAQ